MFMVAATGVAGNTFVACWGSAKYTNAAASTARSALVPMALIKISLPRMFGVACWIVLVALSTTTVDDRCRLSRRREQTPTTTTTTAGHKDQRLTLTALEKILELLSLSNELEGEAKRSKATLVRRRKLFVNVARDNALSGAVSTLGPTWDSQQQKKKKKKKAPSQHAAAAEPLVQRYSNRKYTPTSRRRPS